MKCWVTSQMVFDRLLGAGQTSAALATSCAQNRRAAHICLPAAPGSRRHLALTLDANYIIINVIISPHWPPATVVHSKQFQGEGRATTPNPDSQLVTN